jgi:isorenieratene synthase
VWVRLDSAAEKPAGAPVITKRPMRFIDATIRMEGACEPEDVIANRLDPWHGVHYHSHSFRRLSVVEQLEDEITVRVAFGVCSDRSRSKWMRAFTARTGAPSS